eukprot:14037022-Alexandrium_andersonii.AAC.1
MCIRDSTLTPLEDRLVPQPDGLRACELLRCRGSPCWDPGVTTPSPRRGASREPLDPVACRLM